jgi:TPR repeat protein
LHAAIFFRHGRCPQRKDDCVAETVAVAWKWYRRLAERGQDARLFPLALASLAARHVKNGRRVCGQEKSRDALSPLAQARHGFVTGTLPEYETLSGNPLFEALHDNTRSPVDEQVCFRLDFPRWLARLGDRRRRIAQDMALGNRTKELARAYGLSQGHISQLRRELHLDWTLFCADPADCPRPGCRC